MKYKILLTLLLGYSINVFAATQKTTKATLKALVEKGYISETRIITSVHLSGNNKLTEKIATPLLWSDPATWSSFGATKPVAGSAVSIPSGVEIILDESPPILKSLDISGKLEFADKDINLTAGWIMVMGTFQIGTESVPYTKKAIITLNGTDKNEVVMGIKSTRGIMVMGGILELHGVPPTKVYTKLNENAAAGSTTLTLADNVNWKTGDELVLSTTDYYASANATAQKSTISAINGANSITIQNGLNAQRWGKLQYLTSTGLSLTPGGTLPTNLVAGTPTILDERGEVGNLTRNIVIQSVNDATWQNDGFGCHIMVMRLGMTLGVAHINGIEIVRGGQSGILARYPFHWHMESYQGANTLADVTGQYIRNSVVNQSSQRGMVIHGTNGAEISNNIIYDVRGHGIFTEDASERRNLINGNIVLKVRNPLPGKALKIHESENSSGFWISNPDNTITNNYASDCEGFGYWLAFPTKTFGFSAQIQLNPSLMKFGVFNKNNAHSNQNQGIFVDNAESDELGNTGGGRYTSTTDMQTPEYPYDNVSPFELGDFSTWKNNTSGIWSRTAAERLRRVISADNSFIFFSGASDNINSGQIEQSLAVGQSFNYNMNGVIIPDQYNAGPPAAFASYHSTFDIKNNVVVNFPGVAGSPSGAFAINDYYLIPIDKGAVRNTNNILINSHPGVRTLPAEPQHVYGVIWDPQNYWGGPAGHNNNYVFDNPFFTYGLTKHLVPPSTAISGGVIVDGPFYGFDNYTINQQEIIYDKIKAVRTDINGNTVGTWTVEAGQYGDILGNMRHFAAHPTGYYYLDFPTINNINDFMVRVSNMLTPNDYQVVSMEYSGSYKITNLFSSTAYNMSEFGNNLPYPTDQQDVHTYAAVANFQAVVDAPQGEVYWQDRVNNKVWFKVRGGLNNGDPSLPDTNDINLYKDFKVRAYGSYSTLGTDADSNRGNDAKIYPNPTKDIVSIEFNSKSNEKLNFILTDTSGREVKKFQLDAKIGTNIQKLSLSGLPDSIYFITISDGKTIILTKKVIKK